jgi:peptide/nickel transport system permease protein
MTAGELPAGRISGNGDMPMLKYLVKRFFQTAVVLFVVSVIVFCVMSFTGDPVLMIVPPNATDAQIAEARIALGLDQPL